jgi:hypothetical protein
MIKRNYGEWERFIKTLEDPELRVRGDAMTELDRLMLNFLSSVNALFNHFKVHFRRLAVADDSDKKFKDYVRNLEKSERYRFDTCYQHGHGANFSQSSFANAVSSA